jgi:hypothetical protein
MYTCWQVAMKYRLDEGVVCFVLIFAFRLLVSLVLGLVRLLLWFLELVMTCVDLLMGFKALYAELLFSEVGS